MNKQINDGGPAFPSYDISAQHEGQWHHRVKTGLTLRDYFAAQALIGTIIHGGVFHSEDGQNHGQRIQAERAYAYADAMLAARKPGDA